MRRTLLTTAAVAVAGLLGIPATATVAVAAPIDDAVKELRAASLWVAPEAGRVLDADVVVRAIGDAPIKIAILPAGLSVSEVRVMPRRLAGDLPGNTTAVIAGRYFYAGSEVLCRGEAGKAASAAIEANEAQLDADDNSDITAALVDFVTAVRAAPQCTGQAARADRYADEPGGGEAIAPDDTAAVLPWVALGVGAGAIGVAVWARLVRRQSRATAEHLRQQAHAAVDALAGQSGEEAAAQHAEAAALLLAATTDEQYRRVVRLATGEEERT